jgi:hypothetical protein
MSCSFFSALLLVRLLRFRQFLKLILNQVERAYHFVKIIVACLHRLPKLPESTKHKQAIPNKGLLFYSPCDYHCIGLCSTLVFLYRSFSAGVVIKWHVSVCKDFFAAASRLVWGAGGGGGVTSAMSLLLSKTE